MLTSRSHTAEKVNEERRAEMSAVPVPFEPERGEGDSEGSLSGR